MLDPYKENSRVHAHKPSVRDGVGFAFAHLLDPIRDEDVGFMRSLAVAIGSPHEALAIGGEHREAVEVGMKSDALLVGAVFVDGV